MNCDYPCDDDEDCKYRFDSHCTLPPLNLDDRPEDAECKKEIRDVYSRYVNRNLKELKRDYRQSD